jgi:hypothetical protein
VTDTLHTPGFGRRLVALALFALCMFTALLVTSAAKAVIESPPPPQVWSDKADYAPGETVTLSGANWAPGEAVHIRVNDDAGQTWSRDVDVTAADDGTFIDQFNLPTLFVAVYSVTATGASSGTATWSFTDGDIRVRAGRPPANTNMAVTIAAGDLKTFSSNNCSGSATNSNGSSFATTTSGNGYGSPSPAINVASGASLSVNVPATVTVASTTYSFASWQSDNGNATLVSTAGATGCFRVLTNGQISLTASYVDDATPPTVTVTAPSAPAGQGGYFNAADGAQTVDVSATDPSNVTSLSCTDNGTAVAVGGQAGSNPRTGSFQVSSEGTHNIVCQATDGLGNSGAASGSSNTATVKIDKTAPTISDLGPTPAAPNGSNGWYTTDVSNKFEASDATSGLSTSCVASFPLVSGHNVQSKTTSSESSAVKVTSDSCSDVAGNTAAGKDSAAFKIDKAAPTVTVTPDRGPDHNGWYNHAVVFSAASSNEGPSGAGSCDPDETYAGPDDASASVSMDCTDGAGNTGSDSASFQYDGTAPTINATLTPAANGNGWNNTDVDVHFTCSDNLSGIDPAYGCPADQTLMSEGLHTLHVSTADVAGNVVTASFDVRIDKTNPTITGSASPTANSFGWNNTNVTVSFSCADGLSGLDSCESDHVLGFEGAGQSVTGQAKDKAGNQASATVTVNIDKTKPVVAVTGVSNGAVYTLGAVPAAGCSTSDGLSGVKTAATLSSSGGPVGSITASCNGAADKAGNTNSASVTYTVVYNFSGFFAPIDNPPVCNVVKAGSAVPVKFSLHGYQGMSIFASGYPKSQVGTCAGSPSDVLEEAMTAGQSSLNYDATADQYIYVWKTEKSWAGTARLLTVMLADGTTHLARFTFTR